MLKPSANIIDCPYSSRYALVVAVAKRARQITQEAQDTKTILVPKPVELAVQDFVNHRCIIIEPDPNAPEEEEAAAPAPAVEEASSEETETVSQEESHTEEEAGE